jgi:hypothetical protein
MDLFSLLKEHKQESQSQINSQSCENVNDPRDVAVASEGHYSTNLAGGNEFINDNLSNPNHRNNE